MQVKLQQFPFSDVDVFKRIVSKDWTGGLCVLRSITYIFIYICKGARMCAHYGARKPACALGCEDVRTFEREEVRTLWCVYARKPILYISLNFRTVMIILMKNL